MPFFEHSTKAKANPLNKYESRRRSEQKPFELTKIYNVESQIHRGFSMKIQNYFRQSRNREQKGVFV